MFDAVDVVCSIIFLRGPFVGNVGYMQRIGGCMSFYYDSSPLKHVPLEKETHLPKPHFFLVWGIKRKVCLPKLFGNMLF